MAFGRLADSTFAYSTFSSLGAERQNRSGYLDARE